MPDSEPQEGQPGRPELGDVDPEIRELQRLDPLGIAHTLVRRAQGEIVDEVVDANPSSSPDELRAAIEERMRQDELGVGLLAVRGVAEAQKAAYLESDDVYRNFPYPEMQRVLAEEGFRRVYHEEFSDPEDLMLHEGERYPRPPAVFEIWWNPEGTVVDFDTNPEMDYSGHQPRLLGQRVNGSELAYNWIPDPRTFVYYSERPDDEEWRRHVDAHHYSLFTESGHFLDVSDEEWEDLSKRVWVGCHHPISGGLRYALHNLRRNGRLLEQWLEAPSTTAFTHWGDSRLTRGQRRRGQSKVLAAAQAEVAERARARYDALPEEVKRCIGPFHTWETRRDFKRPVLSDGAGAVTPGQGPVGPEHSL